MAWGYTQVFTGRAALPALGAFTATIMSANVFLIIIPNQKIVVADLKAGRKPDPKYGKIAKQRSLHNNYLTLPVIFLMLSNHYPLAFATEWNWVIASARLPHGRADPALFQHDACAEGQSALDLGGDGRDLHRDHVAVDKSSQSSSAGLSASAPETAGEAIVSRRDDAAADAQARRGGGVAPGQRGRTGGWRRCDPPGSGPCGRTARRPA
jgi:hypothetical protein